MKIVAVTSCPSGVAHTYMSAESLELSAKKWASLLKLKHKAPLVSKIN